MPPRRLRLPVVIDTNVVVAQLLSRTRRTANARVYDLWLVRRELQLVVSPSLVEEYLELLKRIGIAEERAARFRQRLLESPAVTRINLGKRFPFSRDRDDDFLLATAHTGRARYLITNDRDLLEISIVERRQFRFEIVTPQTLLRALNK